MRVFVVSLITRCIVQDYLSCVSIDYTVSNSWLLQQVKIAKIQCKLNWLKRRPLFIDWSDIWFQNILSQGSVIAFEWYCLYVIKWAAKPPIMPVAASTGLTVTEMVFPSTSRSWRHNFQAGITLLLNLNLPQSTPIITFRPHKSSFLQQSQPLVYRRKRQGSPPNIWLNEVYQWLSHYGLLKVHYLPKRLTANWPS